MAAMELKTGQKVKLILYSTEYSTRFLFRVLADMENNIIDITSVEDDFYDSLRKNAHDIYVIDTCDGKTGAGQKIFGDIVNRKFKGLRRVILIVTKAVPEGANSMAPFGPLCFLEYNFTGGRLGETVEQIFKIRDTGSRVTIDPKFFDITIFFEK